MRITHLLTEHWSAVKTIYEQGIATGHATFQTGAPEWEEWDAGHLTHTRLVALENGQVIGWAALTPVSGRCVYAGVAEVSVYIAPDHRGKKIGEALLKWRAFGGTPFCSKEEAKKSVSNKKTNPRINGGLFNGYAIKELGSSPFKN